MESKDSKAKIRVIFGMLFFTIILMAEFYIIVNYPKMFLLLAGTTALDLLCLYVVISGWMEIQEQKKIRQEEQYDSIFKSEKASYLLLKKYFEEIEDKLDYIEEASKIPTEEIINAQKGIAKVIINRGHENTEALMNSYDELMSDFSTFKEKLAFVSDMIGDYKDEIIKTQKESEQKEENTLQVKIGDALVALKDMELRLNNTILQSQKVTAQVPVMAAPMQQVMPVHNPEPERDNSLSSEELAALLSDEETVPKFDEQNSSEIEPELEKKEETLETLEEQIPELEAEPIEEKVSESAIEENKKPEMPDLSDPNKSLSADEIAALFANMSGDEEEEPNSQPVMTAEDEPEEVPEGNSQEQTASVEEKPEMPDLSDPNKSLSPDEIAALFANMGA